MNTRRSGSRLPAWAGGILLLVLVAGALAQAPATGRVTGRIFNPATGEYVRHAEVRLPGTALVAYSGEGGFYQLDDVPAGTALLQVAFSGYRTASASVSVAPGGAASLDFELQSTAGTAAEVIQLGQFIVSTDREGNAKAIMEQRRNLNISTSVAADIYGDVAEGNVGEFLKFLPGVDLEYVSGVSRGPRIGGLDGQYVGVTFDGARLASADAFTAYGSTENAADGAQSRSMSFEQMSITAVESIEVSRTASADMDADAPAGTINLKTKRAFDRKGRRIDWQVSLSANSEKLTLRDYGPDDQRRLQVRPNYMFDYADVFLNQRLGVRLSLNSSFGMAPQQAVTHTFQRTPTAADPRPVVLMGIQFRDGPRTTERFNATLTADLKATPRLVLSLAAMFNGYNNSAYSRALTFAPGVPGTAAATGRGTVIGTLTDLRTNGLANNTGRTLTQAGATAVKLTNSLTLAPRFEYKLGRLTLDGLANYSRSRNDYEGLSRGTPVRETVNPVIVDFRATRPHENSPEWTITQLGGPDWSNLANYTNPGILDEGRFAFTEIYTGELNAKYVLPWRMPTFLKAGAKVAEEARETRNASPFLRWSYIGPGGGPTGSYASLQSPRPFDRRFGSVQVLNVANPPAVVGRDALAKLFRAHPEYFVPTGTVDQYYNAFIASQRDFTQVVAAAYGMANTRLGPWQLQGGLRWERTETRSKEFDPLPSAQVAAAGYPVSAANRRATTIPGLEYQYRSRPRVTRTGDYDNLFPSLSAKYALRPDLEAQVGYSHAIARPPIDSLAGIWVINDAAQIITAPNPNLRPELTDNYVARLAWYFEPVGSLTLLGQQIEITDQRVSRRIGAAEFGEDDPTYAAYEFQTFGNNDDLYRYRSLELGYNQQLTFLPGWLRGTTVNLSYTRNYANQYFPGVTPHRVTGGFGWSQGRYNLRVGGVWQDDTPFTTQFGRYRRSNLKVDLNAGVKLGRRLTLFVQGRNILNQPELVYEGDPVRGQPGLLYRYSNYGVAWVAGIKGSL